MPIRASVLRIAAIIPTYNEAPRIAEVLKVLCSYPHFVEVIVVDDGSTDGTEQAIRPFAVTRIRHEQNQGKGAALQTGVVHTSADILFFCDADVRGMTHQIVDQILQPVLEKRVDMQIGMRDRRLYRIPLMWQLTPLYGGERALTRELWNQLPEFSMVGFKIEAALNFVATNLGQGFGYVRYPHVTQVIKEKKYGLWNGGWQRLMMCWEIAIAQASLRFWLGSSVWKRLPVKIQEYF